jgi:hypothetical protein
VELCDETKDAIKPELYPALFKLANRHDLAHIICDALEKNRALVAGSKENEYFSRERNKAIYRYNQQRYVFSELCEALEKAKISYLPLKGSAIRDYYPTPWYRSCSDIDVLVSKEDVERVKNILTSLLGYKEGTTGTHDVNFYSQSGVHIELHFALLDTDDGLQGSLEDFEKCTSDSEYRRIMTPEEAYFYHIAHMARHMRGGGCGVKPFLDLIIMERKIPYNPNTLEKKLATCGLLRFEYKVRELYRAWFFDGELDECGERLEEYILSGGVYGSTKNRVAVAQVKQGGKVSYFLSRIFMSYSEMTVKYPSLKKCPPLFPLYQVYRWFDLLINKKSREYTKATIRNIHKTSEENLKLTEQLLSELGL